MKLSDIKGEKALDVLADIIDPISEISADQNVVNNVRSGNKLAAVKVMLKSHQRAVIDIMAYLNCEDPKTYNPSLLELPALVLEVLNDPVLADLFTSGDKEVTSSGSPMESTEESEN